MKRIANLGGARRLLLASLALLGALVALSACSSSAEATPPDAFTLDRDTGAEVAVDTGAPDTTPGDAGAETTPDAADTGAAADASDATPDTANCRTDAGCWSCPPTVNEQFLNHCSGLSCQPFDNKRVTKWDGGTLPPI
jgi:hypothetical protein